MAPGLRFNSWVRQHANSMSAVGRLGLLQLYLDYFHEHQPLDQPITDVYQAIDAFLDSILDGDPEAEPELESSEPGLADQIINNLDESALDGFVPSEPKPGRTIRIQKTLAVALEDLIGVEQNPIARCELMPGVEILIDAIGDHDMVVVDYDGYIFDLTNNELLADFPQVNSGESVYKTWERPIVGGVLTPLNGWHRDPLSHRPDVIGQTGRHRGRSSSPRSFAVAFP